MAYNNYPDGVTGREWWIAGPDREYEDEEVCNHITSHYVISTQRFNHIRHYMLEFFDRIQYEDRVDQYGLTYQVGVINRQYVRAYFESALSQLKDISDEAEIEAECSFQGEVSKETYGNTTYWECPWCGYSHESHYERDVPDYD